MSPINSPIDTLTTSADRDGPIEVPTVFAPRRVSSDIDVIPGYLPVPGMGVLPANSFLIRSAEPVLVDAGPGGSQGAFPAAVASLIDPAELRWLWLTHTDPDHTANIAWLLDAAPQMKVVTTYLAMGKQNLVDPIPMDRWYFANPGDRLDVGDRELVALRPPTFDAPETVGLYDTAANAYFSADAFGALMSRPQDDARDIGATELAEGMVLWSTVDAPWLHLVDRTRFAASLEAVRTLDPDLILSCHLPPAVGMTTDLTAVMAEVPGAPPWTGPDQSALMQLRAATQA